MNNIIEEKVSGGQYNHCIFLHLVKYESFMKTYRTELLNLNWYLLNKCRQKNIWKKEMFIVSFLSEHTLHS